jgi:uncharacterized protein YegP (UPF0339 family)
MENLPQSNPILPTESHKNWFARHILAEILGIVIFVAIIAGGYYYQASQVAPEFVAPVHHSMDATANWKAYTNAQYGFELKYPNGYTIGTQAETNDVVYTVSPEKLVSADQMVQIVVINDTLDSYSKRVDDYLNSVLLNGEKLTKSVIVFGGQNGINYSYKLKNSPYTNNHILVALNAKVFEIRHADPDGSIGLSNQILSTFKFTNSKQTQTGTLKGHVTIGPFCPVEKVNTTCAGPTNPYVGIQIVVNQNGKQITTQNLSADGNYSFDLPAGNYAIDRNSPGYNFAHDPLNATVTAGQTTLLNINIDTGIR